MLPAYLSFVLRSLSSWTRANPPWKKDTELVSWINYIKSDDSSKLGTTVLSLKGIRHIIINNKFYCQRNRTVCFREKNVGCVDKFKTIWKAADANTKSASIQPSIARISCHPIQNSQNSTSRVAFVRQGITRHSFLPGFLQNFCPISEVDFSRKISVQFCPNLSSISAQFEKTRCQDARCTFLL